MTKVILLTGFLGSGKTTLLKGLLKSYSEEKIGVVMNEFGEIGIDGKIIGKGTFDIIELNNGSIFCACLKENFIKAIIEMTGRELKYLFIEASGLADPSSMGTISKTVQKAGGHAYDYRGSICIIDAMCFMDLVDLLPAIERQVLYSDVLVVNKIDLQKQDNLEELKKRVSGINPEADIILTSYCTIDYREIIDRLSAENHEADDSTNTPENRPKSICVSSETSVPKEAFITFLKEASKYAYRIKGFFQLDDIWYEISTVNNNVNISMSEEKNLKSELVIISSVGISIVTKVLKAWQKYIGKGIKII